MALIARGMYKLLLRVSVEQSISQAGWRYVLSQVLPYYGRGGLGTPTFDGEILCISAMGPNDMSEISENLMSFGFRWSENLDQADFAWFAFQLPELDWLQVIEPRPLRTELPEVELWQLRGLRLQYFVDHDGNVRWRGKDYEW